MKKNLVGFMLAVMMCVMVLCGCDQKTGTQGNATAEQGELLNGYEGKWLIYAVETDGVKKDLESYYQEYKEMLQGAMTEEEIEDFLTNDIGMMKAMVMELKGDEKVIMTTTLEKQEERVEGTWKETEKGISLTIEGDTLEFKYEKGDLTIKEEESPFKICLTKEEKLTEKIKITKDEYAKIKAEEEAKPAITEKMDLNTIRQMAISDMVKNGGSKMYAEKSVDSMLEILVQYSLELEEDGTGFLSMAGMPGEEPGKEKIKWKEKPKRILVTTEEDVELEFIKEGSSLSQEDETLGKMYLKKSE